VVKAKLQLLYPRERDLVSIVQQAGWAAGPVWMGTEYFTATGIEAPDCPAHSIICGLCTLILPGGPDLELYLVLKLV
jgi:hypothetical protein